jgi:hypothetical protein
MTTFTGLPQVDPLLADVPDTVNRHGNRVRHVFLSADRYLFDFHLDLDRWAQLDTESDAWYFGIWVDKAERRVLSYVEGDVYLTRCADDESYDREIAALCAFHGPAPSFVTIDDEKVTAYYQDRARFFIDPKRAPQEPSQ